MTFDSTKTFEVKVANIIANEISTSVVLRSADAAAKPYVSVTILDADIDDFSINEIFTVVIK